MEKLFTIRADNKSKSAILQKTEYLNALSPLNRERRLADWTPLDFTLFSDGNSSFTPDICTAYYSGVLVLRAELRAQIFPDDCDGIEFLPVHVDGTDWNLVNCLNTTHDYDPKESLYSRCLNGEIFLVQRLRVSETILGKFEIFTIDDSNRAQLFAVESFVNRIKRLKLKGITFKEIGIVDRF